MTDDLQATPSCCGAGNVGPTQEAACHDSAAVSSADDDMTTCPVMAGTPVSKTAAEAVGLFRDYEGERYHFCCRGCGSAFDADPAKYAASAA